MQKEKKLLDCKNLKKKVSKQTVLKLKKVLDRNNLKKSKNEYQINKDVSTSKSQKKNSQTKNVKIKKVLDQKSLKKSVKIKKDVSTSKSPQLFLLFIYIFFNRLLEFIY